MEIKESIEEASTESKGKTRTYIFKVVIEEDPFDDERMAYHAYCPSLKGASTWGYTKGEVLKNVREVVEMTVESMIQHGEPIPEGPEVQVFSEPVVAVTV
jgi:predicted RNase H-like HicB family nuclease